MTVYEKNLKVLAEHYPGMDTMIEEARKTMKPKLKIIEETAYSGETILKIEKEDKAYYLNGKRNTVEPAQIWVETLGELQPNAPVLMVGTGNPSYLKELVEHTENRITIIIYEPSIQIFLKFLEMAELESWMKKHLIVFWVDGLKDMDQKHMEGISQSVLIYEMLNFSKNIVLPNYGKLFPEETVGFMKTCRDIALRETMDFNTKNVFSAVMVKNLFLNARYLCNGYKTTQLPDVIPRDIPGILVAAGPSLNKNIQELKKAKGKAFIVAVDTAMKPLLQAGIKPDMYAIVDAMKPLDLVKIEESREIPLLTTLNAAPEILEYHKGMKFFFNEGYQFAERIFLKSGQKIGDVSCGGSVATSVFSLLYKIGIDTVILVGQDLAYTDNKSHADGTFHEVMDQVNTSHFRMVEGNYEEKVPTRNDFKVFIDWYNMYIEGCQNHRKSFRVINATEGGAKIQNTEIMTLREAIQKECTKEVDIQECFGKLPCMLDEGAKEWAVKYLKGLGREFQNLSADAQKIVKLYQKLDKVCKRRNIDQKEYLNLLKKIERKMEDIGKRSTYQLVMITMNNAQYILSNEQFLVKDSIREEGKEMARKGILYMKNVADMAKVFQEFAEEIFIDGMEEVNDPPRDEG